jgi:hypothetical protein
MIPKIVNRCFQIADYLPFTFMTKVDVEASNYVKMKWNEMLACVQAFDVVNYFCFITPQLDGSLFLYVMIP